MSLMDGDQGEGPERGVIAVRGVRVAHLAAGRAIAANRLTVELKEQDVKFKMMTDTVKSCSKTF